MCLICIRIRDFCHCGHLYRYTGWYFVMPPGGKVLLILQIENFTQRKHSFIFKKKQICIYKFSKICLPLSGIELTKFRKNNILYFFDFNLKWDKFNKIKHFYFILTSKIFLIIFGGKYNDHQN